MLDRVDLPARPGARSRAAGRASRYLGRLSAMASASAAGWAAGVAMRSERRGLPLADHVQRAVEEAVAAGVALDLAAGGLGNAAGLDQHDRVDGQFVLGGDAAADGVEDRGRDSPCWRRSISCTTTSSLAAVDLDGKRRRRSPAAAADGSCSTVSSMSCG